MTQEFRKMLQLAAMGATGHAIDVDCADLDWPAVVQLAKRQKTDCYLAYALKHNKALPCPGEIRDPLIKESRALMFYNAAHKRAITQLLEDMERSGIHAVLLKGYAVADCYAMPECRTSGDADIWIAPKDEERACAFMKERGFSVLPRWENGHHAVCDHPSLGCVELHVILYDEIVEEVWFGKMDGTEFVVEPHRQVETQDGKYYTLGHTDHLIFLALHMIKHFIISGLTVQMMLDVALYFKRHAAQMDVGRVWKTIRSLHYEKLLCSILWAMIQHCGFSEADFPGLCSQAPEQVEDILSDLEKGGWMGFADKRAREEGWYEYNRQKLVQDKSKLQYWLYMIRWKWAQYMAALFPSRTELAKRYPCVQKSVLLVPFAWVHRLIFRGPLAVRRGLLTQHIVTDESKLNEQSKTRVSLFKELDML